MSIIIKHSIFKEKILNFAMMIINIIIVAHVYFDGDIFIYLGEH